MTRNRVVSGILLALFPTVAFATPSNQFEFSNTLHGTVCSEYPNVWLLGGELKVDAPISINGSLVTREGTDTSNTSLKALLGADNNTKQHFMKQAISCIQSEDPIALIRTVASLYEKQFTSLSSTDIPAPIPEPELPEAPNVIKDQFETQQQFEARIELIHQEHQQAIAATQQKYRQQVEARNQAIRAMQHQIEQHKSSLEDNKTQIFASAFRDVMGKPIVTAKSYDAEKQQLHVLFKASNQNYQRDLVLNIPLEQAREVYENADKLDLALFYAYDQKQLELVNITAQYNKSQFTGDIANSQYKPEILSVESNNKASAVLHEQDTPYSIEQ
ncbi:hypothetical protein [Photobacterium sp. 53610]|uniref:hypothetical protein n=1 Tax=Photobacterium sp. 53610 TaxID=3102789 RepID=UPI002EDB45DB